MPRLNLIVLIIVALYRPYCIIKNTNSFYQTVFVISINNVTRLGFACGIGEVSQRVFSKSLYDLMKVPKELTSQPVFSFFYHFVFQLFIFYNPQLVTRNF